MKNNTTLDLSDEQPQNMTKTEGRQSGIQVISRVSAIMRLLSEHREGLSLAAIAKEVGLPRSTVQRFIYTLEKEDLVESLGSAGGFRLGPALGRLINRTQTDVIDVVRPYLNLISKSVNETVVLSHLSGIYSSVIEQVVAENVMRIVVPLGESPIPCYKLVDGLAILSRYSNEKLKDLIQVHVPHIASDSKKQDQLLKQIAEVRKKGIAINEHEQAINTGISMVSIPIETYMGIYAISIIVPTCRFQTQIDNCITQLIEIGKTIEHRIGI